MLIMSLFFYFTALLLFMYMIPMLNIGEGLYLHYTIIILYRMTIWPINIIFFISIILLVIINSSKSSKSKTNTIIIIIINKKLVIISSNNNNNFIIIKKLLSFLDDLLPEVSNSIGLLAGDGIGLTWATSRSSFYARGSDLGR